jgi:hypothetical protein
MTWQNVKDFFSNPIVTFVLGIFVSIITDTIFFRKGKNERKPKYYIKSNNLVSDFSNKLDNLRLFYIDKSIKNLTISKIAFWNEGKQTIENDDIVERDPLRIESLGDFEILDVKILKQSNELVNNFSLEQINNKQFKIKFKLLDKMQGVALQVIHTGKGSSDIIIDGYVEGAGKPTLSYTKDIVSKFLDKMVVPPKQSQGIKAQPAKTRRTAAIFALVIGLIMLIAILTSKWSVSSLILGLFTLTFYGYLVYLGFKRRVPKELELIEEEDSHFQ